MKHFTTIGDFSRNDINKIYSLAKKLKSEERMRTTLKGKTLALLFEKASTRTRTSFDIAVYQLGGHTIDLSKGTQFSRGAETLEDTTRVLDRYVDGIVVRLYKHEDLLRMAKVSKVPIINGLTDLFHPCQALADIYTLREKVRKKNPTLAFVGDGRDNVANSLVLLCDKLGINLNIATPKELRPLPQISKGSKTLKVFTDPKLAVKDADAVYTDVWVSMGQERIKAKKMRLLKSYQVNSKLMSYAKKGAYIMHCLPAHRGQEITNQVIDSPQSIVLNQAENRLHVQKALLSLML